MKLFRFLLALCIPAITLHPVPFLFSNPKSESNHEILIPRNDDGKIDPWGYLEANNLHPSNGESYLDHYESFLDLLGNENFLERLSSEEIDDLIDFVVNTVEISIPRNMEDLQQEYHDEINDLFESLQENDLDESGYSADLFFHSLHKKKKKNKKNWFKRKCHHLKHWSTKHKKELIIGGIVVAAATGMYLHLLYHVPSLTAVGGALGSTTTVTSSVSVGGGAIGGGGGYLYDRYQNHKKKSHKHRTNHNKGQNTSKGHSNEPNNHSNSSDSGRRPGTKFPLYPNGSNGSNSNNDRGNNGSNQGGNRDGDNGTRWGFIDHGWITANLQPDDLRHGLWDPSSYLNSDANSQVPMSEFVDTIVNDIAGQNSSTDVPVVPVNLPITGPIGGLIGAGASGAVGGAATGSALTNPNNKPTTNNSANVSIPSENNVLVYEWINPDTGNVGYVGITNDFDRRFLEHQRKRGMSISRMRHLPQMNRYQARAVEQTLIEIHKLQKNGGTLTNKINSISKWNPEYANSLRIGEKILREAGYIE